MESNPRQRRAAARLLAKKETMSRVERDAVFDAAMERVEAPRPRITWPFRAIGAIGAFAGAGVALVAVVLLRAPDFTARGIAPVTGAATRLACSGGECTAGSKLLFEVTADPKYRYMSAFARRKDGAVLWYFPDAEDAASVELGAHASNGIIDTGILLGPEHRPGEYEVTTILSDRSMTREEIRALITAAGAGDVSIVHNKLRIR